MIGPDLPRLFLRAAVCGSYCTAHGTVPACLPALPCLLLAASRRDRCVSTKEMVVWEDRTNRPPPVEIMSVATPRHIDITSSFFWMVVVVVSSSSVLFSLVCDLVASDHIRPETPIHPHGVSTSVGPSGTQCGTTTQPAHGQGRAVCARGVHDAVRVVVVRHHHRGGCDQQRTKRPLLGGDLLWLGGIIIIIIIINEYDWARSTLRRSS